MAGVLAAPVELMGGMRIAYNCNLVTCRAAADVFLDESREVKRRIRCLHQCGPIAVMCIISMSMDKITSSSQLKDAIVCYGKNKPSAPPELLQLDEWLVWRDLSRLPDPGECSDRCA